MDHSRHGGRAVQAHPASEQGSPWVDMQAMPLRGRWTTRAWGCATTVGAR